MRIAMITLTLMVVFSMGVSSTVFAECYTNARGRYVCGNGQEAGGNNAKTGNAWKSERNQNGVATTQTSAGGEPRPKLVVVYIRALMAKIVTRQHIITAVIEVVWQNEGV
jgi:hypothetical protein